jgi:hypothetical protein
VRRASRDKRVLGKKATIIIWGVVPNMDESDEQPPTREGPSKPGRPQEELTLAELRQRLESLQLSNEPLLLETPPPEGLFETLEEIRKIKGLRELREPPEPEAPTVQIKSSIGSGDRRPSLLDLLQGLCGSSDRGQLANLGIFSMFSIALGVELGKEAFEWAWHWQILFLFVACALGLIAIAIAAVFKAYGSESRQLTVLLWLTIPAWLIPCAQIGFRSVRMSYRNVVPLIDPIPLAIAAFVSLAGTLITNALNRSAYSRSVNHEWKYVRGGRYGDATNLDVWEHYHGRGSWKARIQRHRIVWSVVAVATGLVALSSANPSPGFAALCATGGATLVAIIGITAVSKR